MQPKWLSFIAGLLILFVIYHFPELFSSLWIAAVFKIGFLIIAYFIAKWQGVKRLQGFGLKLHKGWIKNLGFGILIGISFFLLSEWISLRSGFENLISVKSFYTIIKALPLVLAMTFFPSIDEDILTRGYPYGHLNQTLKPTTFVLVSSLFYVVNHIWRLSEGIHVLSYLFILGLVLAWALIYTKSLWLTLGLHWGSNIAFETINASIVTNTEDKIKGTWILAASFALMFVVTYILRKYFSINLSEVQRSK